MSNLSPWKSNQTVTSLFLPRNGHITHTTINILSLCAHGIPWYPPSGPEMDGNGNAVHNYPTNYHANPENGQIFAQKEITNFNYYVAKTYFVSLQTSIYVNFVF